MWSIHGARRRFCDGLSRREFLRAGVLAGTGLSLPTLLAGRDTAASAQPQRGNFGRAKRCVLVFLHGGPPQHETWDPKPDAPADIRGEFRPIDTAVPGIRICELFPKLAKLTDRLTIVRSVTHEDTVHTSAGYTMLTGAYHARPNQPPTALPGPTPSDHPPPGSVLSFARGPREGMPPFVAVPEVIKDAGVNTYPGQGPGFLDARHAPLLVATDKTKREFVLPEVVLAPDVTAARLADRRVLLDGLNRRLTSFERDEKLADLDAFQKQALGILASPAARRAFEIGREPQAVRERYGNHLFGQGCLLARRLLESGVSLVTVYWHYEGPEDSPAWDTHENNFRHMRERLAPPSDAALGRLVGDLDDRGMLDDTLFVCLGEFGRSPKINGKAGREHWPQAQSILLAGAGLPRGYVHGASDRDGGHPAASAVTPPDLMATIYHLLGVPTDFELHDREGRPIRVVQGAPIPELVA